MPFKDSKRGELHCVPEFEPRLPKVRREGCSVCFDPDDGALVILDARTCIAYPIYRDEFIGLSLALVEQAEEVELPVVMTAEEVSDATLEYDIGGTCYTWDDVLKTGIYLIQQALQSKRKEGEKDAEV